MMNLFEIFDPSNNNFMSINWSSILLIFMFPSLYWISFNRMFILSKMFFMMIFKEFKLLSTNKYKINIIIFINLLMLILIMNISSLPPFIFNSTSHLFINLSMALPLWLSFLLFMLINKKMKLLAHLTPMNTPFILMNFMVLIELISNIIRPWTLSIRLSANMIAGHLLLTLLGNFISMYSTSMLFPMIIFIQNMLYLLEIFVAMIQAYVFSILSLLYFTENK
uniref:ATP synthase subunit a n=1 Tax=Coelioxys fenestrata TaxID=621226 RepID=A0A7T5BMU1_9HYME|nr:ATP synthase F0 subunit 6 [Coelioxys fenestrata]QQD78147.1 ATP synthase subunit 6 [Coelioxys fenestrata]